MLQSSIYQMRLKHRYRISRDRSLCSDIISIKGMIIKNLNNEVHSFNI